MRPIDLGVAQRLAGLLVDEHGDRHAPGALARQHQSGRVSTIERMRLWPARGTKRVASIAASAVSRRVPPISAIGLSMAMNHCGVLRKITGALERQECG